MEIKAKITGIKYKPFLTKSLAEFGFDDFDINSLPASCLINDNGFTFGLSKWVSPKRTRSYPYARVYDTLGYAKRITVIPIIKDEGQRGDRDFIQWDTVSLMSLLDVFVILTYYSSAEKHPTRENKITNQKFDNEIVKQKISEIKNYHSSALHWNLKEIKESLPELIDKAKQSYKKISEEFDIKFHAEKGIDKFAEKFINGVNEFMDSSRTKAEEAQSREIQTVQPKEALTTATKAKITIENYLGGKYYFTTNEIIIEENKIYLIEAKHSKSAILPSIADIKDGLLKMILYSNLTEIKIGDKNYEALPVLKLTSTKLTGSLTENNYMDYSELRVNEKSLLEKLFDEAKENNFRILIEKA